LVSQRRVPAERYDRGYLLSEATEGYAEYRSGSLSHLKALQLEALEIQPGTTLLEIGFGRGELLRHCAVRGAIVSGIDYSPVALEIARSTLAGIADPDLRLADCRDLPFDDNCFDRTHAGDVLEHLDLQDGSLMLKEMYRVTRPGGFLFIHTAPNTTFTRIVYPLLKPFLWVLNPKGLRTLEEHRTINQQVHVQEYSLPRLRRVARLASLPDADVWIGADILRSGRHRHTKDLWQNTWVRLLARLGSLRAVRFFLGNDLYLKCVKPDAARRSPAAG
jgi:ubiquinone/menaquinone biosynthesis C-methylase UbiE